MINEALALSYDFGTQSVRAIIFNKKGDILGKRKLEFKPAYFSEKPGWAEQYPEVYWDCLCEVTKQLKSEVSEEIWLSIKTIGVTTMRDVAVCMDNKGTVLRPIILWLDQRRSSNSLDCIPASKRALFNIAGMRETIKMQRAASFCNWIKENEPEIWANTEKYVMFSAYINFLLTGKIVDSVASIIGHFPFNYKAKRWMGSSELTACVFDTRADQMAELVPPGTKIGEISKEVAEKTGLTEGTPVIAGGSDKGCETLGTGSVGNDVASISLGTSATIQITTDKYVEPQPFLPAYPSMFADKYNPEIQIFRGYWMVTWFKKEFAMKEVKDAEKLGVIPEVLLDSRLSEIPAGSHGLVLQPYWSPGVRTPEAKGAIIGFSDVHTRVHLYRAIIEGIGYALYDGLKAMEKRADYKIKRLMVSGGGANSEAICQITADLTGLTVQKIQTYETSALGVAMAAFVGIGEFANLNEAVKAMSHITKEYLPNMEVHNIYEQLYSKVYKKIYKANKKFYEAIRDIYSKIDNTGFAPVCESDEEKEKLAAEEYLKKD